MDLRQLRQFVAVAEHLHFGRAAQTLAMAQPPLSRAIRALETELGVPLFERSQRRVALTDAGRVLLPDARQVLAAAGRLAGSARSAAAGDQGELALAFVSIVDYSFLPDLLRRFTGRFPGVRVNLRARINLLRNRPFIGVVTSNPEIRMLPPTRYPYRIYYTVQGDDVVILHIRHTARSTPTDVS